MTTTIPIDDGCSDLSPADRIASVIRTERAKFFRDVSEVHGETFQDDPFDGHGPADCRADELGGGR